MKANIEIDTAEAIIESPLGDVLIVASPRGVCRMEFEEKIGKRMKRSSATASPNLRQAEAIVARAARQIEEYFAGRRKTFDVPLDLNGTEHQQRVWKGLLEIPFGKTLTYGDLARRVGTPRAARAVGHACGSNPVWLIVPCHRVIGSDGSLHGYGGGLWRKEKLLEHEGARHQKMLATAARA